MPCTTLLVGKKATYDGSTIAARNEDSGSGSYSPKRFVAVRPEEQPRHYRSVISHVEIELPDDPMGYTAMPNAVPGEGIWGAAGVNAANVSMTATETITTNERVLAGDPLVVFRKAEDGRPEQCGGIGEEDMVTVTLPYIKSAREGVERLGSLLRQYGTYEMNGIAFQDKDEIWWLETIGGHHWIARRVPDQAYVIMPNQFGIDSFDLSDAFGAQKEHLCSPDLREFIRNNHLDLGLKPKDVPGKASGPVTGRPDDGEEVRECINARLAFGSHSDSDHIYNTPRAWFMARCFNRETFRFDGPEADYRPDSDDIPWCLIPDRKITIEDVKYVLSGHFNGTPYDPYRRYGDLSARGQYRPIGINRNNFLSVVQIRPDLPEEIRAIEWITYGSNVFNALAPFYVSVGSTPEYLSCTGAEVTTQSWYWANRLIAALADAQYPRCAVHIERYQMAVQTKGHEMVRNFDREYLSASEGAKPDRETINEKISDYVKAETAKVLDRVLYEASNGMKNGFSRSDA